MNIAPYINTTNWHALRRTIKESYSYEFSNMKNPTAVTLTLEQAIQIKNASGGIISYEQLDENKASASLRLLLNKLNKKIFGNASYRKRKNRPLKRLDCFPVLEFSASGRPHYHIQIERPDKFTLSEFENYIKDEWPKTRFGYHEVVVKDAYDENWISYCHKDIFHPTNPSIIDFDNLTNNSGLSYDNRKLIKNIAKNTLTI